MKSRHPWRVVQHGYVVTVEDADRLRRMVERTCAEQGIPVEITDPEQVENLRVLLGHSRSEST